MSDRVSISGPDNQLGTAVQVRNCLDRHNLGVVDSKKVEVLFFGGVALDLYWKLWSRDLRVSGRADARKVERELSVYSADQVFEAGLYIDPGPRTQRARTRVLTEAATIIISVSDSIRGRLPQLDSHISLLEPGNPFANPNCVVFDVRVGRDHAQVPIPHPSLFLLHTIRQIQLASDQVRPENDGVVNWHHRNRRSAQARLLRLFVDLLDMTGHSNFQNSDAIWPVRIRTQSILEFPGQVALEVLTEGVAKAAAEWEARAGGLSLDANHVDRLYQLYIGAFELVKQPLARERGTNSLNVLLPPVLMAINDPAVSAI